VLAPLPLNTARSVSSSSIAPLNYSTGLHRHRDGIRAADTLRRAKYVI
jgi:hypothetical protein